MSHSQASEIYNDIILQRSDLSHIEKHHTLHLIMGQGEDVVFGGAASGIGDKGFIRLAGYYSSNVGPYSLNHEGPHLTHELGDSFGLIHNFNDTTKPYSQCDNCNDNGCPIMGYFNNYMDYSNWEVEGWL